MAEPMPYRLQPGPCRGETTLFVGDGQLTIRGDVATVERYLAAIGVGRPDPAPIADALEAAADAAGKDAVWCASDERAIAQAQRAATYRRLAAVLREPGFGEGRHG